MNSSMNRLAFSFYSLVVFSLAACSTSPKAVPVEPVPDISRLGTQCNTLDPLQRILPKYPSSAVNANQEGWSVARVFIGSEGGRPERVEIIRSSPPEIFGPPTAAAISQWEFRPIPGGGECYLEMRYRLWKR